MFNFTDFKYKNLNLKIMKSNILPNSVSHFFTTRIGGDTPEPLQKFTLSAKDYPSLNDFAIKNQKIACEILGGNYENFIMPNQQHTDKIAILTSGKDIESLKKEPFDGIITNLKNCPVCMVFADCVPVLIFDKKQKILACIHAGWKGTAKKIVQKAVKTMVSEFNSTPENISAVIGAAICQKCFEVNYDVARQLGMVKYNDYANIFIEKGDKIFADLKNLNKIQLMEVGIDKIDVCEYCTSCNNDIFYSYRADNKCTGRHGMLAMIKE